MAPKFGLDDGCISTFDATMVLATMLTSHLNEGTISEPQPAGAVPSGKHDQEAHQHAMHNAGNERRRVPAPSSHPLQASDHTRIWSELSGSVARSSGGVDDRHAPKEESPNTRERNHAQMLQMTVISENPSARENISCCAAAASEAPTPVNRGKMQNEEGQMMDLYIPRKCSATNRLITSKDHGSVQINIGHLDANGLYTGSSTAFALCGFVRAQGDADSAIDRLWQKKKVQIQQQ